MSVSKDATTTGRLRAIFRPFVTMALFIIYLAGTLMILFGGDSVNKLYVAGLLGLVLFFHIWLRYYRPIKRPKGNTPPTALNTNLAFDLQRRAGFAHNISPHQARAFLLSIIIPEQVRQRVVEHYTPSQRTLKRQLVIDGKTPYTRRPASANGPTRESQAASPDASAPPLSAESTAADSMVDESTVLIPIAVPMKGRLYDNFFIDNGGGNSITTLTYPEYLELVACVIRTMLHLAYGKPTGALPKEVFEAEHAALIDIMHRGVLTRSLGAEAIQALASSDTGEKLSNPAWITLTAALVERLASRYALVARAVSDSQNRFVVRYEHSVIPELLPSEDTGLFGKLKGMLRVLLGARPVNLKISLHPASTCQSYHLYVHSEQSLYLSGQKADMLVPYLAKHEHDNLIPPHHRFRKRLGQSYAHFYTRYFPAPAENEKMPFIFFRFYEKPPGSSFRAAIAAVACLLLVWLVGYVSSHAADPKTDAPAFLLIVPALAAALLGFESSGRRLMEGTLAARLSLILTAATSLTASGLYMIRWAEIAPLQGVLSNNLGEHHAFWLESTAWSLVVVVALLNAFYITFTYLVRAWEFTYLSTRASEEGPG